MRQALEDEHDLILTKEEQKESVAHGLRIMEVLQLAFSDGRFTAGRMSGEEVKRGLWMIQVPIRCRFLRGK